MNYLIIGAGIAGTSAAEIIRKIDLSARITLITSDAYPLYSRITLGPAVGGQIPKNNLLMRQVEQLEAKQIAFLSSLSAQAIDRDAKTVSFVDNDGREKVLQYDKLLIATGGVAKKLETPPTTHGIFYLHNLDDIDLIRSYANGRKKVVVSGGSFLGIDFISAFQRMGMDVLFLIRGKGFMHKALNPKTQSFVHSIIEKQGIKIKTNAEIKDFHFGDEREIQSITTNSGEIIETEMIGMSIGIDRITPFIRQLNLPTRTGLLTNEFLQTIDPDIFAAGDIVEYFDILTNEYSLTGNWLSARLQGETAGKNMTGQQTPYEEIPVNSSNIFGINLHIVGQVNKKGSKSYEKETENSYIQIFTREGIVIGGIIIGDNAYMNRLMIAIKEKKAVTSIDI